MDKPAGPDARSDGSQEGAAGPERRNGVVTEESLGLEGLWAIYQQSPDAVLFTSPDGRIFAANPAASQMFQMNEAEICALGRQGLADESDPRWKALLEERARVGAVKGAVARMRRADGSLMEVEMSAQIFTDAEGKLRSCTICRDVTERSRLQGELEASEQRYHVTLDALEGAVIKYRVDGSALVPTVMNRAAQRLFGRDAAEFGSFLASGVEFAVNEAGEPLSREEFPPAIAARTGNAVEGAVIGIPSSGGSVTWLRVNANPLLDEDGRVSRVVTSAIDVTEQRRVQSELERTKDRFAAMVEHGSDLIVITGADRCLRYASPSIERILGLRPEEHIGRPVWELVHPDDRERLGGIFADLKSRPGDSAKFEARLLHEDGTFRYFVVTQTNLLDDPAVEGFVGNANDISERVAMEQRLAHQATHDALTGLSNRSILREQLTSCLAQSERAEIANALLYIDLDGFKAINDTHGHLTGDQLLIEVGRRLSNVARQSDTVARLGGDEFAVLAQCMSRREAEDLGERIQAVLCEPFRLHDVTVEVGASIGVALVAPAFTADELLATADRRMYRAKMSSRTR